MLTSHCISIVYDNLKRIHKVDNFPFNWNEPELYTLKVLSFTEGLIFDNTVQLTAYENFKNYFNDNYKIHIEGLEIIVIVKNSITNIPLVY